MAIDRNTLHKVRSILREILACDDSDLTFTANLEEDLDCDSIDTQSIVDAVSEEFGVAITDEDWTRIKTVADLLNHIEEK